MLVKKIIDKIGRFDSFFILYCFTQTLTLICINTISVNAILDQVIVEEMTVVFFFSFLAKYFNVENFIL